MKALVTKSLAGLVAGAGLVGALAFTVGFQQGQEKIATVNLEKVMVECSLGVSARAKITARGKVLEDMVKYMDANNVMSVDQATKIRDLTMKDSPNEADKAQLAGVQAEVKKSMDAWNALLEKKSPTKEELDAMNKLNANRTAMDGFLKGLQGDLQRDFSTYQGTQIDEVYKAAKAAIKETAAKKGYTIVLNQSAVVFSVNESTNDITADATKAVATK
jgi:Skp family chaperone for outer membrane proteins